MKIQMQTGFRVIGFIGGITLSLATAQANLSGSLPKGQPEITLVQSIPLETNLAQPDLPDAKDVWIKMIADAHTSIDMGQFYLSNETTSPLEPVIVELEKAGTRGVKIRTIIDNSMVKNDTATLSRLKRIPNLELRILDLKKISGGIIHAKYFVMDGETVFIGSQNFDWKALNQIHETGVLVRDPSIASQLTQIFNIDWEICKTGQAPTPAQALPVQATTVELVASPPQLNPANVRWGLTALKELLNGAKKSIRFQVLDYSTSGKGGRWGEIDDALRAAARRGVQVDIMVSDWSTGKAPLKQLKELSQIPGVTVKIVTIPAFSGGCISYARTIHTKMMVVDGETLWVGTSNWSQGYFTNTRDVEMIFHMRNLAQQGNRIFETLWQSRFGAVLAAQDSYSPPNTTCSPKTTN